MSLYWVFNGVFYKYEVSETILAICCCHMYKQ